MFCPIDIDDILVGFLHILILHVVLVMRLVETALMFCPIDKDDILVGLIHILILHVMWVMRLVETALMFCPIDKDDIPLAFLHILILLYVVWVMWLIVPALVFCPIYIQRRYSTCILTHSYSTVCGVGHVADCASFGVLPNIHTKTTFH